MDNASGRFPAMASLLVLRVLVFIGVPFVGVGVRDGIPRKLRTVIVGGGVLDTVLERVNRALGTPAGGVGVRIWGGTFALKGERVGVWPPDEVAGMASGVPVRDKGMTACESTASASCSVSLIPAREVGLPGLDVTASASIAALSMVVSKLRFLATSCCVGLLGSDVAISGLLTAGGLKS